MDFKHLILPYSPWFDPSGAGEWQRQKAKIPPFHRPIFRQIARELEQSGQIVSVTGPRRVGKSTLLRQVVQCLLDEKQVPADRIIYYSFDDAALYLHDVSGGAVLESIMDYVVGKAQEGSPCYLLLDEIQTLEAWELYLKKYYDLNYPVRVIVSGSASSPIFKKSRESLLGRVKDYHVLPFSFREYLLFQLHQHDRTTLRDELIMYGQVGDDLRGMLSRSPQHVDLPMVNVPNPSPPFWEEANRALGRYMVEGGFPEVWKMDTQEEKIDYLFRNQVTKVITEDLVLAVEFRKPELLKKFYISLLEKPGREVNMSLLSSELGINVQQINKYIPLLEMTDLVRHADKFRPSAVRAHQGNQKFFPIDLALRNAVLRLGDEILQNPAIMGTYAETLVFNALKKWPGVLGVDYYREAQHEVDFVVHTRPSRYFPLEVKYRNRIDGHDLKGLLRFMDKFECHAPILVTKRLDGFGNNDAGFFQIPLALFLLLFD